MKADALSAAPADTPIAHELSGDTMQDMADTGESVIMQRQVLQREMV